jgi:hypothetical protein
MPSLSYFAVVVGVAVALSVPASAQNGAKSGARVRQVAVHGSDAAMEVEIQTSGAPVAPNTQALTGPDRIIVDFPGALPADELRALQVNRGPLRAIRAGLFFSNPPITRVVLDLAEPQSYRISTTANAIVIKLGPGKWSTAKLSPADLSPAKVTPAKTNPVKVNAVKVRTAAPISAAAGLHHNQVPQAPAAQLKNASLAVGITVPAAKVAAAVSLSPKMAAPLPVAVLPVVVNQATATPPRPSVIVTYGNGILRIHADKATLAAVLYEVQRQTKADIAIPSGAELEQVMADIGPAPARDVLASLLNGSPYNFIFVGNEGSIERVILTLREP